MIATTAQHPKDALGRIQRYTPTTYLRISDKSLANPQAAGARLKHTLLYLSVVQDSMSLHSMQTVRISEVTPWVNVILLKMLAARMELCTATVQRPYPIR